MTSTASLISLLIPAAHWRLIFVVGGVAPLLLAPGAYPTTLRGVGVGMAVAAGRIGSIVGPKLGGILKSAGHGPSQLLMDLLPIVIVGSISALLLAWYTTKAES